MPGLIEQILGLATIEQIEKEQSDLRITIAVLQKQMDALDQVLRFLIVARDGKPPRKTRQPREASSEEPVSGDDIDETPVAKELEDDDVDETPTLSANQRAVLDALRRGQPMSVGEISHAIKVVYATAYGAIQKLIEARLIVKSGDKLALKV